jgi:hypothetical protein
LGLISATTNGLWLQKNGNNIELHAGSYLYTNWQYVNSQIQLRNPPLTLTKGVVKTYAPGVINDDRWHHIVMIRASGSTKLYVDNILQGSSTDPLDTVNNNNYSACSIGRLYGYSADTGLTQPATNPFLFKGKIDRLKVWKRGLTTSGATSEVAALYQQDIDNDGLWDITENNTKLWRDTNSNGIQELSELTYQNDPFRWQPLDHDTDGDGLTDIQEQSLGTGIATPDSDFDLMPDGWEFTHGLNPKNSADATLDNDIGGADGLTNLDEYRYNTDSKKRDTDGDGILDGAEAKGPDGNLATDDGSNPNDPSDAGTRPPATEFLTIKLGVGDRSGSHSEDYVLNVFQLQADGTEKRIYTLRSGGFGQYKEETRSFPKSQSYTFQIDWQGTNNNAKSPGTANAEGADFDYHLVVEPLSGNQSHLLIDSYDPRTKTADPATPLRDPGDINPSDDDNDDVTTFLESHEPKRVVLLRASILVDANRDGQFSAEDEGQITEQKPWRIWINNDDDWQEIGGTDIPDSADSERDYANNYIDQERDLIDFFPATLQISAALRLLPTAKYSYTLKNGNDPLFPEISVAWLPQTQLTAHHGSCDGYLKNISAARQTAKLQTHKINSTGKPLPSDMTDALHNGHGMFLVEGRRVTAEPLRLEIKHKESSAIVLTLSLPLRVRPVEEMFRHVDLLSAGTQYDGSPVDSSTAPLGTQPGEPVSYPDSETNGKYFVFLHGFNVTPEVARGWKTETFKRMHQLGSRARFVGVTWRGSGGFNDYHGAVFRALQTGDALGASLAFTQGADVTIAAHSLGNMVVSQAIAYSAFTPSRYYMINGAVTREAFDAEQKMTDETYKMVEKEWRPYTNAGQWRLLAANWHQLFAATPEDARNKLTRKNRFRFIVTDFRKAYNFYSPGDEVVQNPTEANTNVGRELWRAVTGQGGFVRGAWVAQEYVKGGTSVAAVALSRTQAGWRFNFAPPFSGYLYEYSSPEGRKFHRMYLPNEAAADISNTELITKPFFSPFSEASLHSAALGNAKASEPKVQYDLLASGLPAISYAMAPNSLNGMAGNINMESKMTDPAQWPSENHSGASTGRWLHSDMREVALCFLYQMYEEMINLGNLK